MKRISIKRLLLATDFSDWARRAENYAGALAASWHVDLTVMTVLEFPPGMDPEYAVNKHYLTERMADASSRLAEFKGRLQQRGVLATTRIGTGIPSAEITAAALAEMSDLVIVGTRGMSGLAHVLLGSTAERLIRTAPCPVLAVHAPNQADPPEGIRLDRILVPTDFSEGSLEAARFSAVIARQAKASIELLHVMEPVSYALDFTIEHPDAREQKRKQVMEKLQSLSSEVADVGNTVTSSLFGGAPADAIVEVANKSSYDLIIMGTHGRRGLSHAFAGSVTEAVLRRGNVPVLAVRHPAFSADRGRLS